MKVAAINSIYDVEIAEENGHIIVDTYNVPYRKGVDVILTDEYGFQKVLPKVSYEQLYVPIRVIKPKPKVDYESMARGYEEMGTLIKDQNEYHNELHKLTSDKAF